MGKRKYLYFRGPNWRHGLGFHPEYDCLYADRHSGDEEKGHGIKSVAAQVTVLFMTSIHV